MVLAALVGSPPAIDSVTIAELIVDAGGVGQTRTINDPTYPGANGAVTWVASDPITGVDPGGNARYWARYPDGSGGYWRRDDWDALGEPLSDSQRVNFDWCTIDSGDNISTIFSELITWYVQAHGNALFLEGLNGLAEVVIGNVSMTGDGTATQFDWKKPDSGSLVIKTPAYASGTEDLMGKVWTNEGGGRWSATVTELVAAWRGSDSTNKTTGNSNAMGGSLGLNDWLVDGGPAAALQGDVASPGDWHYDDPTDTLSVGAPSDPSTFFENQDYFTSITNHDVMFTITDVHKLRVGGGLSRFGGQGMEFRGRLGVAPRTGYIDGSASPLYRAGILVTNTSSFSKSGSVFTWLAGTSEFYNMAISMAVGNNSSRQYERINLGGIHLSFIDLAGQGETWCAGEWVHFCDGTGDFADGDPLETIRPYGNRFWDGTISPSGATNSTGTENSGKQWGTGAEGGGIGGFNHWRKITGQLICTAGFGMPFFGQIFDAGVQLGNSALDPLKFIYRCGNFATGIGGDTGHLPNARPVFFDDNGSTQVPFGKCDSWNTKIGGTAFVEIDNRGIVDRDDNRFAGVDIRLDGANDILNVVPNPASVDTGFRHQVHIMESTETTITIGNVGATVTLKGEGPNAISQNEDARSYTEPHNFNGQNTYKGNGATDVNARISGLVYGEIVEDITFLDTSGVSPIEPNWEKKVRVASEGNTGAHWTHKPHDQIIRNDTFKADQTIHIGRGDGDGLPPYNVKLTDLTITGDTGTRVEINPYEAGRFNQGHPVTVIANNVTNWDNNVVVDTGGTLVDDDVYFSPDDGTTYYELPYTVGGSNTTKSAPPDLVSLNRAVDTDGAGTSGLVNTPIFFKDGNLCIVVLHWDGDPGTVTPATGFSLISGTAANTSAGDCYVKAYQGVFADATDIFDLSTGVSRKFGVTFSWTNSARMISHAIEYQGQNASPIGSVLASADDTADTTATCPTLTGVTAGSMVHYTVGTPSGALISNMSNGAANILNAGVLEFGASNYGVQRDSVLSAHAAELYVPSGGSITGMDFTLASSQTHVVTAIEIKT